VNDAHLVFCASPEWRQIIEEVILPVALSDTDLGDHVIEIGTGPGFTTDVLRTRTARLTAVEVDDELAATLASRLEDTNVKVVRGDATALDFDDGSFTGAASFHMLHHVEPPDAQDQVFAELARVLRPGGVLVAADGVFNEETKAFHADDVYNPVDPDTLGARLHAAGFSSVQVQRHDLGWTCTAWR
jgi:ubiquinone/menaquinone biosynthesis C-methylase UbiE